ncbi:lipase [Bacillus spizizenii]|uniref:lipase n=1 Tax=Bacillus spizizenii TaxID=96241 RepID=UPI0022807850|nr:lipase [Bacillus spizizenii]MCY7810497.1 lipase [Bacillus spizizenii]MCY7880582.1 lipase [Bacillus spizizenii]MCY7888593.1 lipase [Bacillus spizizenii]MCY8324751.1 lipase [Bacillus spizizenii]MCY8653890.1 lipase [Bacillus spizizenii]
MAKNKSIKITDEDYNRISSAAYDIQNYHIGEIIYTSNGQKLYVIDYKKTKKGLNALTLVTREDYRNSHEGKHPEKIQNAIIAYRGSEPISWGQLQDTIKPYRDEREQLIKEVEKKGINIPKDEDGSFYDYAKGVPEYSNEILQDWLHMDTRYLVGKKPFDDGTENQAIQADQYAKKIHKDFKNADIQVTGHSLGGSNASYAVVMNDFIKRGVTFENPNIYENLPEDVKARALKGDFRSRLTEYINLNDGLSLLNRDAAEVGKVKVMYDEALPNGVQNNGLPDVVKMLGLAFKHYNNQSLDVTLFAEALMGSHGLDRYNFNSDGYVQTVDDVLKNNPEFALAMLKQMKSTNVKANTGVSILIKSHVLMNTSTQLKHIAESEWSRIIRQIERIDDKVKDTIEDVRNMHTRMVGFGTYDELSISDVDDLINKLKMNKPHHLFYSKEKYDQAVDAALHLQHLLQMVADDLGHMGHAYHDADLAAASRMGIS